VIQDKYKHIPAIIIAITGLITAVGACIHKPEETGARAGYLELTKAILDTQEQVRKNQDDLLALRTYLDEYVKSHESIVTSATAVLTDAGAPILPPPGKPGVVTHVISVAAATSKPPPAPASAMKPLQIRSFDSL